MGSGQSRDRRREAGARADTLPAPPASSAPPASTIPSLRSGALSSLVETLPPPAPREDEAIIGAESPVSSVPGARLAPSSFTQTLIPPPDTEHGGAADTAPLATERVGAA